MVKGSGKGNRKADRKAKRREVSIPFSHKVVVVAYIIEEIAGKPITTGLVTFFGGTDILGSQQALRAARKEKLYRERVGYSVNYAVPFPKETALGRRKRIQQVLCSKLWFQSIPNTTPRVYKFTKLGRRLGEEYANTMYSGFSGEVYDAVAKFYP